MNPDRSFYGREISRILAISSGSVHAALWSLEDHGILESRYIGKTRVYRSASTNAVIRIFTILNTLLVLESLIEALKTVSRRVILFGSYATGSFTSSSDLDLFIVSREKEKASRKIDAFKRKSGLDIRPIIKNQAEWTKLEEVNPEFFDELGRGVTLWEKSVNESGF
jgi:predicted nucleotidyltransferase